MNHMDIEVIEESRYFDREYNGKQLEVITQTNIDDQTFSVCETTDKDKTQTTHGFIINWGDNEACYSWEFHNGQCEVLGNYAEVSKYPLP